MQTNTAWSRRSLLLAGGLLLTGCGYRRRPVIVSEDHDSGDSDVKRLREVLARRAKALKDGDEAAYLAGLDGSGLVAYERRVFSNLRQFELADIRYITESTLVEPQPGGQVQYKPVVRVVKLSADAGPGGIAPAESFVYRMKDDQITGITPVTRKNWEQFGGSGPMADAPWHTDELKVVQVGEKIWLAADRSVTDLGRYASVAERELDVIEGLWGRRTTYPGHVLFFTRDAGNYRQWFGLGDGDDFNPGNLGYQVRLQGVRKDGMVYRNEYAASRIVVNLSNHGQAGPAATVRHELAHAVTARATMTSLGDISVPTWAVEGFARYTETVGDRARAARIRAEVSAGVGAGKFRGAPPANKQFYGGDVSFNYALGSTVFSLAERLKGREAAVELYARVIQRPDSGGGFFDLPIFDGMARDVLGLSAAAFRSRWASYVRSGG